jgi:hypothetical protein
MGLLTPMARAEAAAGTILRTQAHIDPFVNTDWR